MKATLKSDQALPLKVISKEGLNRKETGARAPGTRFDDVLSGLAEARNSTAKTTLQRAAEPTVGRPGEAHHARSGRDAHPATTEDAPSDSAAPLMAVHLNDATGLVSPLHRAPSEQALPVLQIAMAPATADDAALPDIDALLDTSVQIPTPADPKKTPVTSDLQVSRREAGARSMTAPPSNGSTGSSLALSVKSEIASRFEVAGQTSRSDEPVDLLTGPPAFGVRAAVEAGARLDVPTKQLIAFPTILKSDPARALFVGADFASRQERVGPAESLIPSVVEGEGVSVLGNEKHFRPVAPASQTGVQPTAPSTTEVRFQPNTVVQRQAGRSSLPDSAPAPEERRLPIASRAESLLIPTSSPASPMQQLAGAVAQEIGSPGAAPLASTLASSSAFPQPAGREPLRILKVQLAPADLGHVTIRLRLTGDTLDLRVTAERAETASMLDRDRHLLSRVLEASGYSAGDVTVQPATPLSQPNTVTPRSVETQPDTQSATQFQSNGSAPDGERQTSRFEGERRHSRQETGGEEQDLDPRRRDDLYV